MKFLGITTCSDPVVITVRSFRGANRFQESRWNTKNIT